MNVETRKITEIKKYGRNHKKHSEEQIRKLVKSVEEFGITQPILVNKDGVIIAGEGRYLAFKKMGLEEVPVIVLDLPEDKEKVYRIADNELNVFGVTSDFAIKIEELGSLNLDAEMLGLANLKPQDFSFSSQVTKFDPAATITMREMAEAEAELTEEVHKEVIGTPDAPKIQSYHFYVEVRSEDKKENVKNEIQQLLNTTGAIVR